MPNPNDINDIISSVQRADPRSWEWKPPSAPAANDARPVDKPEPADLEVEASAAPEAEPKPFQTNQVEFWRLRRDQNAYGTKHLWEHYESGIVQQFLDSKWNLYPTQAPATPAPPTIEEIAAQHHHQNCACETCGDLLNAGYRPVTDDSGQRVSWLKVAEPKAEAPKVKLPEFPPAELLPPHLDTAPGNHCDCQTCVWARRKLVELGFYWNPYDTPPAWRRLGT
jgi:hypothetical protein